MRSLTANRLVLATAVAISFAVLVLSWNLPLLEAFSYRQTQTAMSAYWMASSNNWLAYPTPMFGHPWSIPFEFPLFQALALGAANLLPINLDQAGRMVSWLFALATLLPLHICVKEISGRNSLASDVVLFFLLSPLYLFGARSFLIESTALCFAVLFLAIAIRHGRRPSPTMLAAMLLSACAAALVKITTFFPFGALALAFVAWKSWRERSIRGVPVAISVAVAIAVTATYIHYADLQKFRVVTGATLTSDALSTWNYGTWAQRTSSGLWLGVALGRSAHDLLGSVWMAPAALILLGLFGRGLRGLAACCALGYALPFAVFSNLHEAHRYYQQANGVFLLAVVACAIEAVRTRFGDRAGRLSTALVVAVMLAGFYRDYLPSIANPHANQRTLALAAYARQATGPDDVLLVFNDETSPEIPYYATRRAMLVNAKIAVPTLQRMRAQPASYTGAYPLGMVIVCPNKLAADPQKAAAYRELLQSVEAGRQRRDVAGCETYR